MRDIRFEWDPAKAAGAEGHGRGAHDVCEEDSSMRKEYDFSQARPNPYARRLKQSVTIRIDEGTIAYFKGLAAETGIPYQTLINSYLRDCAATRRRPAMRWVGATKGAA
jgi:predicted DNA binding CopG/RHH family protein